MPRSKRNRQVSLTQTKKKGLPRKQNLIQEVRDAFDKYDKVFVYSVSNMRNTKLKDVRQEWKDSRFYFGKNKVMAVALGRCIDEDHRENLHRVSERLRGQCGLFFTNAPKEKVLTWFEEYSDPDFARSGFRATERVFLDAGPLPQFQHSLEPHLRHLGLPTSLQKGVVTLIKDHEVCKEGEVLKPEQASILKLLGIKMAEFKVSMEFLWNSDGTCEVLRESSNPFGTKTRSLRGKKRQKLTGAAAGSEEDEDEEEEEEEEDNDNDDEDEEVGGKKADDEAWEDMEENDVESEEAKKEGIKKRPKKLGVRRNKKK
ncbi:mRNA turnover protein 4 homolog [Ixodes scapularis]|uniref:mRNA turnover protein 4 homolog n=1 Tax=Ixodes scapularis TaxID=6945 RepID=UPI001C3914D6|nr:mRNA turnover protein 4 homolog [Ixodes scapularis]